MSIGSKVVVAGLDGGGTKTALCCLDGEGREVARAAFGPLNINSPQRDEALHTLTAVGAFLQELESQGHTLSGLVIASAGMSNPEAKEVICAGLLAGGCRAPVHLMGDHEAALYGAVGKVGAVLIAGTGSICFGQNAKGQSARAGGWGYLLDDEGAGYAIGRDMMKAALRALDGRGQPTIISGLLAEHRGLNTPQEMVAFAYDPERGKSNFAGLSELLMEALGSEDAAALAIVEKAASELLLLCETVLGKLGLEQSVLALSGGILNNIPPIRARLTGLLAEACPLLNVIHPRQDAAWGAAELAGELYLSFNQ